MILLNSSKRKARAWTHPIFGKITRDQSPALKVPKGRISFDVDGESSSKDDDITNRTVGGTEVKKNKCPRCDGDHFLTQCGKFKKDTVKDEVKLVRK